MDALRREERKSSNDSTEGRLEDGPSPFGRARTSVVCVPRPLTRYIPRHDVYESFGLALEGVGRVVTLVGIGGVGKTRLVKEYAHQGHLSRHGDVWFCDLTQAKSEEEVSRIVANRLNITISGARPKASLLFQLKTKGRLTLILDNVEGAREAVRNLVAEWVIECSRLKIISTSRLALGVEGERVCRVNRLDPSDPKGAEWGMTLFLDRSLAAGCLVAKDRESKVHIQRILESVAGLPLAIELAAAQLRFFNLESLSEHLSASLEHLCQHQVCHEPRRLSLESCFNVSWEYMNLWERAALAQLSVFTGSFSLDQAEAVVELSAWDEAPGVVTVLARLVDQSLVSRVEESSSVTRYELLCPVQKWAEAKLDNVGTTSHRLTLHSSVVDLEEGSVLREEQTLFLNDKEKRLLQYLSARPGQAISRETLLMEVWGYHKGTVTRTIDSTMRSLRAKLGDREFRHLQTERGTGYRFVSAVQNQSVRVSAERRHAQWFADNLKTVKGALPHGTQTAERAAEIREMQRTYEADIVSAIQRCIARQDGEMVAHLMFRAMRPGLALEVHAREFAEAMYSLKDAVGPSGVRVALAYFIWAGEYERVLELTESISEEIPANERLIWMLRRGNALTALGRREEGRQAYFRVQEQATRLGMRRIERCLPGQMAWSYLLEGKFAQLGELFESSEYVLPRKRETLTPVAMWIASRSMYYMQRGEWVRALHLLDQMSARLREEKSTFFSGLLVSFLSQAQLACARMEQRDDLLERAEKTLVALVEEASEQGVTSNIVDMSLTLALVRFEKGDIERAHKGLLFSERLSDLYTVGLPRRTWLQVRIQVGLGRHALHCGHRFEALDRIKKVQILAEDCPLFVVQVPALLLEAEVMAVQGQRDAALAALDRARKLLETSGASPNGLYGLELRRIEALVE